MEHIMGDATRVANPEVTRFYVLQLTDEEAATASVWRGRLLDPVAANIGRQVREQRTGGK